MKILCLSILVVGCAADDDYKLADPYVYVDLLTQQSAPTGACTHTIRIDQPVEVVKPAGLSVRTIAISTATITSDP
jgi:hypothetical protein